MSYAIVRNEKLTRDNAKGSYIHNDRRSKNHSNKNIDPTRTYLNYYLKKNELSYIKEFDKLKNENDLKGQIRSNSIIMCEMIFTSDQAFFDKIGTEETKRFFDECYKFICSYKNLEEKNIISAVVHLDEASPHMHLIYIPVIHTKDKDGNNIDKICARDFWKGRDSYRNLQNAYFKHIKEKGFDLERGLYVEETSREHLTIQQYKSITNYENTKETLKNIKLEFPETPDLRDIKKVMLNRDEKIENEIIKPKDNLIQKLYQDNLSLHKQLSKQSHLIDEAEKYQKERDSIIADNKALNKKVENLEKEFDEKTFNLENKYHRTIYKLEKENHYLTKIITKFEETIQKFIHWICKKFSVSEENNLFRDFEKKTNTLIDPQKQLENKELENEMNMEM